MYISRKILCISIILCLLGAYAYGYSQEPLSEDMLKNNLEEDFGINIVLPNDKEPTSYKECLQVIERGLNKFPKGVIKEITQYYSETGIKTNIIISKTEKISELFSKYYLDDNSANVYINALQNNLYNDCVTSEEGFMHEIGHLIGDYLFKIYGYEKINNDFLKFNEGYSYGNWEDGYDKVFVNKHFAESLNEDVANLIWYAEIRPEYLRTINDGNNTVTYNKLKYIASVMEQSFLSITPDSRLWNEAIPQNPDSWARDIIQAMKDEDLIPEEFDGIYKSNISKDDFYTLTFHIIENKLGKEKFNNNFQLTKVEEHVAIDPVKGEVYVNNCKKLEKYQFDTYKVGLEEAPALSKEYITRLEIAKLFSYISNKLGIDISNYKVIDYTDLSNVKESDKSFIYFVSSSGLLMGNGDEFNPYSYCTYQEAYIILMRLYNML